MLHRNLIEVRLLGAVNTADSIPAVILMKTQDSATTALLD